MVNFDPYFHYWFRKALIRWVQAHRRVLAREIQRDPLLKREMQLALADVYDRAVGIAANGIGRISAAMPSKCPYTFRQILNPNFIPDAEMLPFNKWQAKSGNEIVQDWSESVFHVTRLPQGATGLPMNTWALERTISSQVCAVAVSPSRRPRETPGMVDAVLVEVSSRPKILFGGSLENADWKFAERFVKRNVVALRRHWNGETDSMGLFEELRNPPMAPKKKRIT